MNASSDTKTERRNRREERARTRDTKYRTRINRNGSLIIALENNVFVDCSAKTRNPKITKRVGLGSCSEAVSVNNYRPYGRVFRQKLTSNRR